MSKGMNEKIIHDWDKAYINTERELVGAHEETHSGDNLSGLYLDALSEIERLMDYSERLFWDESRVWMCEKCGAQFIFAEIKKREFSFENESLPCPVCYKGRSRPLAFIMQEENAFLSQIVGELARDSDRWFNRTNLFRRGREESEIHKKLVEAVEVASSQDRLLAMKYNKGMITGKDDKGNKVEIKVAVSPDRQEAAILTIQYARGGGAALPVMDFETGKKMAERIFGKMEWENGDE